MERCQPTRGAFSFSTKLNGIGVVFAQSAGFFEYTDWFSAEKYAPHHLIASVLDMTLKKSDRKSPVMLEL